MDGSEYYSCSLLYYPYLPQLCLTMPTKKLHRICQRSHTLGCVFPAPTVQDSVVGAVGVRMIQAIPGGGCSAKGVYSNTNSTQANGPMAAGPQSASFPLLAAALFGCQPSPLQVLPKRLSAPYCMISQLLPIQYQCTFDPCLMSCHGKCFVPQFPPPWHERMTQCRSAVPVSLLGTPKSIESAMHLIHLKSGLVITRYI